MRVKDEERNRKKKKAREINQVSEGAERLRYLAVGSETDKSIYASLKVTVSIY